MTVSPHEQTEGLLERARFWEGPLKWTWLCLSGWLTGRVGSSKHPCWLEPTRFWMGPLERPSVRSSGQIRIKMARAEQWLARDTKLLEGSARVTKGPFERTALESTRFVHF